MPAVVETMMQIERDFWRTFNELRIISTKKRFQSSPPSYKDLVRGWELYGKTKVLEGAYERLSFGRESVYLPDHPVLDILAKVRRTPYQEQGIDKAAEIFHRDVFGTGDGGIATYLGRTRGARRRAATNFFYAMEDLVKEEVIYFDPSLSPRSMP